MIPRRNGASSVRALVQQASSHWVSNFVCPCLYDGQASWKAVDIAWGHPKGGISVDIKENLMWLLPSRPSIVVNIITLPARGLMPTTRSPPAEVPSGQRLAIVELHFAIIQIPPSDACLFVCFGQFAHWSRWTKILASKVNSIFGLHDWYKYNLSNVETAATSWGFFWLSWLAHRNLIPRRAWAARQVPWNENLFESITRAVAG